ncbi:hypothetical protein GCM10028793_01240 [Nocardiopsis oceani]
MLSAGSLKVSVKSKSSADEHAVRANTTARLAAARGAGDLVVTVMVSPQTRLTPDFYRVPCYSIAKIPCVPGRAQRVHRIGLVDCASSVDSKVRA